MIDNNNNINNINKYNNNNNNKLTLKYIEISDGF